MPIIATRRHSRSQFRARAAVSEGRLADLLSGLLRLSVVFGPELVPEFSGHGVQDVTATFGFVARTARVRPCGDLESCGLRRPLGQCRSVDAPISRNKTDSQA